MPTSRIVQFAKMSGVHFSAHDNYWSRQKYINILILTKKYTKLTLMIA